ncbi:MAG: Gfo/Idh/MocA family oxidoreductase [Firmicutes bacterium]|nr:Gfo/Idh/MocA family oxidoreductase [Bacillota bacterium]
MANLRLALVGCGKMGQKHLQALVHAPSLELVATADANEAQAQAAAVAFDAAWYADLDVLLRHHPDVDGIIIATPTGTHRSLVERALEAGAHVLVEKPLALSVEDAMAMVQLAKQRERVLAVTQFNRLLPTVSRAMQAFHQGHLGLIIEGGIYVRWARPQSYYDAAPWRGTRQMDGGVLFNQAIHALDVLLQFSGPIREVFAYSGTLTHAIEVEDTVAAVLRAENGGMYTVGATTSVANNNLEERIVLVGQQGSIVIGPTANQIEAWRVPGDDEDQVKDMLNRAPQRPGWQSHLDALADFERAVKWGLPSQLSGDSAIHTIQVVEALLHSAEVGQPVRL